MRLLVHGNVQGVGFRNFSCRIGSHLGLVGVAKNLPNKTVEIVVEGKKETVVEFLRRINLQQPRGINVEKLDIIEEKEIASASFASFSISF